MQLGALDNVFAQLLGDHCRIGREPWRAAPRVFTARGVNARRQGPCELAGATRLVR